VPRVGHPDPETFRKRLRRARGVPRRALGAHGHRARRHGVRRLLDGLGHELRARLAGDRPVPAGILAFSGFVPTVENWQPDLASRPNLPVLIAHGRRDPIMDVAFARGARALLEAGGLPVEYHESDAGHHIDPEHVPAATRWLAAVTAAHRPAPTTTPEGR
jgi:phospholipase/carboxylesterase